jgi:hypothetical protein
LEQADERNGSLYNEKSFMIETSFWIIKLSDLLRRVARETLAIRLV